MIHKFVPLEEVERAIFDAARRAWSKAGGDGIRAPAEVSVSVVNDLLTGRYEVPAQGELGIEVVNCVAVYDDGSAVKVGA